MREAVSLYLIGAIDLIGKDARCNAKQRKELIRLVLRSNLNLSEADLEDYFNEALYRETSSDNDQMVRAGAKAAKTWLVESAVPSDFSLNRQLEGWGMFA